MTSNREMYLARTQVDTLVEKLDRRFSESKHCWEQNGNYCLFPDERKDDIKASCYSHLKRYKKYDNTASESHELINISYTGEKNDDYNIKE